MVPSLRLARDRGVPAATAAFDHLIPDGVAWAGGTRQGADTILWRTGFRPALSHLTGLALGRRDGHISTEGTRVLADPRVDLGRLRRLDRPRLRHPDRLGPRKPATPSTRSPDDSQPDHFPNAPRGGLHSAVSSDGHAAGTGRQSCCSHCKFRAPGQPRSASTSTPWSICAAVGASEQLRPCSARPWPSSRCWRSPMGTSRRSIKVRTSVRALSRLEELALRAADAAGESGVDIAVHHLDWQTRAGELVDRLRARVASTATVVLVELGAVVGAHVGPGTIAVAVSPRPPGGQD